MSNQFDCSVENFEIIDGEVNIQFDEPSDLSCQKLSDNQAIISTNYGTSTSNGPETEYFYLKKSTEMEIPSNERDSLDQRDMTVLETLNQEDDESLDQQFSRIPQSVTVTDYTIIEESSSFPTQSDHTILSQTTLASRNEETNDSKNVPKGMMKALGHMVLDKNPDTVRMLKDYFKRSGESYEKFQAQMKLIRKSSKISISEIRSMLMQGEFAVTMRKLGCYFLRKMFLKHIFNSKMEKKHIHMKYIPKWIEIFKNPSEFTSLK